MARGGRLIARRRCPPPASSANLRPASLSSDELVLGDKASQLLTAALLPGPPNWQTALPAGDYDSAHAIDSKPLETRDVAADMNHWTELLVEDALRRTLYEFGADHDSPQINDEPDDVLQSALGQRPGRSSPPQDPG